MKNVTFIMAFGCMQALCFPIMAQKPVVVKGEYKMRIESNMSIEEAEKMACDKARKNALENKFGSEIINGNVIINVNEVFGDSVKSKHIFKSLASSNARGEWLGDTEHPEIEKNTSGEEIWITCKVKGRARELTEPKAQFIADPLNCPELKCKTTSFNNREDFYIYFKSSQSGYIAIFDNDNDTAYCIFPYVNMSESDYLNFKIQPNHKYIFGSNIGHPENIYKIIDEYVVYTDEQLGYERLYILFSKYPIKLPLLDKNHDSDKLILPKSLDSWSFQKWLLSYRERDKTMQVKFVDITIGNAE